MRLHGTRTAIGSFVDVPAGRIHVREDGAPEAPAIVLLHGFASSLHWYDQLTPMLTDSYRVIRLDLLGHGCTRSRSANLGAATQADMVMSVLGELAVEHFVPVGHSYGADVAIGIAERTPKADRVVIIGQAPDYATATLPPGHQLLNHVPVARALQALSVLEPARVGGIGFARGFRPDRAFPNPHQPGVDLRAMDPRTCRAVLGDRAREFRDRPLDTRLKDLDVPAMAILGGRDQMYPLVPTRARYDAVPGLRVEVIEHSGHSPNVEAPAEVARLIGDFLSA